MAAREKRYRDMAEKELTLAGAQLMTVPEDDLMRAHLVVLGSIARLHAAFQSTSEACADDFVDDVGVLIVALSHKLEGK